MKFVRVMLIYLHHILYDFGLFIFRNDCFIAVELKAMLNTEGNGYQGLQNRAAVCARTP